MMAMRRVEGAGAEPEFMLPDAGEGFQVLPLDQAIQRLAGLISENAGDLDAAVLLADGSVEVWSALHPYRDGTTFTMALCTSTQPNEEIIWQGDVPVFFNGIVGMYVGVVDSLVYESGRAGRVKWRPAPLTSDIPKDPHLATLVAEMRKSLADVDPDLLVERRYRPPIEGLEYVGAEACAECHSREYEIWKEGPHSTALDTLEEGRQYDPDCVVCHVSDYQAVDGYVDRETTPFMAPINCEVCHGRGSAHVAAGGPVPEKEGGLHIPDPDRCVICHDEIYSPDFHYPTYWKRIRHGRGRTPDRDAPVPPERRGEGKPGPPEAF